MRLLTKTASWLGLALFLAAPVPTMASEMIPTAPQSTVEANNPRCVRQCHFRHRYCERRCSHIRDWRLRRQCSRRCDIQLRWCIRGCRHHH